MNKNIRKYIQTFFFGLCLPVISVLLPKLFNSPNLLGSAVFGDLRVLLGIYFVIQIFLYLIYFYLFLRNERFLKFLFVFVAGILASYVSIIVFFLITASPGF